MIIERRVESMEDLCRELNVLPNHFVFRGQANAAWSLQSSLERFVGEPWTAEKAKLVEDYSLKEFQSKYQLYKGQEHIPSSKLGWLCVMQHYGMPTRLLDFTSSPYVALYFALEGYSSRSKQDFGIFAVDYTALMDRSIELIKSKDHSFEESRKTVQSAKDAIFERLIENAEYDIAWVTEPAELNARVDRQCGTFLTCGSLARPIHSVLTDSQYDHCEITKFTIPAQLYEGACVALRKMNISSKSIYGDLAGLAKGIRMELQPYMT